MFSPADALALTAPTEGCNCLCATTSRHLVCCRARCASLGCLAYACVLTCVPLLEPGNPVGGVAACRQALVVSKQRPAVAPPASLTIHATPCVPLLRW
jgi:hypothetical protein